MVDWQADKGAREVVELIRGVADRYGTCRLASRLVLILLCTVFDRDGFSVQAVDDLLAILMKLAPLPELKQMFPLGSGIG